ncbi:MAG: hypothetical protein SF051_06575, partial [Elusimicrobiota bacterium]|nr:hypothetical protein [Elusimicrobiota bacterium]
MRLIASTLAASLVVTAPGTASYAAAANMTAPRGVVAPVTGAGPMGRVGAVSLPLSTSLRVTPLAATLVG